MTQILELIDYDKYVKDLKEKIDIMSKAKRGKTSGEIMKL